MAFVFCDGFDSYAATSDLTKKWQAPIGAGWAFAASAGRFGGGALFSDGTAASGNIIACTTGRLNAGEAIIGFYVKFSTVPASELPFAGVYNVAGTRVASLRLTTAGIVRVYGANGDLLMFSAGTSIADGNWHWIEWRNFMAAGSALCALYIDNVLINSLGAGNQFGTADHIGFITISAVAITIDDVILYDDSTGAPTSTNYPVNARQITTTRPSSDSSVTFATVVGGTGTHASCVNEVNPNGDTSYVEDGTIGNKDLFGFGGLGYTPTTINAVVLNLYRENPYGGSISIKFACKSGATESDSAAVLTPLTYSTQQVAFPTDPATSAAWTASGVNAALFGFLNA